MSSVRFRSEALVPAGFGLALLLLLAVGTVAYRSIAALESDARGVEHALQTLAALEALGSALASVETSQRGFVITGDDSYLDEYETATREAHEALGRLRTLIGADPVRQNRLDAIERRMRERLSVSHEIISTRREHGFATARSLIAGGIGRDLQRAAIDEISSMGKVEMSLLEGRGAAAAASSSFARATILTGSALVVAVVVLALVIIRRDLKQQMEASTALKETNLKLVEARERAESADRLKSAFLASMSHELRTPLNSIIGFTGILLQGMAGPLTAEQTSQLRMVQASGRHLLALINDVLDLSKIEAGELVLGSAPFDPRSAVQNAVDTVRPLAESKGLELHAEHAGLPDTWHGDRRRMEQILLNLLNNAIKFTDEGEVDIRATALPEDAGICITVSDTGIGISTENMDKLFKPFQQIDSGLSRQHEGTGLGLDICSRLVTLMGGEIKVQSSPGTGSSFTVVLPAIEGGSSPWNPSSC